MALMEFNPEVDFKLLMAVLAIPVCAFILQVAFGKKLPRQGDWLPTGGMFVVMCITVYLAAKAISAAYHGGEGHGADAHAVTQFFNHSPDAGFSFKWLFDSSKDAGLLNVVAGILYDPLGAVMLAVVGIVCFCVHLFSMGYMAGDSRYHIFFANISLFSFAMLGLVLSDNILFLFIFWEIMGLMSYLLIGHFSQDPSVPFFHKWATWASKKAFLTTRIGDCLLFVGLFYFYRNFSIAWETTAAYREAMPNFQPLLFTDMWEMGRLIVADNGGEFPEWMTIAGLCAFGGTIGKSAQFPLHIWLPDAMAGPTPVSAMIHAATMVAAGVFLLGRMYPLMSPDVLNVVAVVGSVTALFAATIGMVVYDLKAVLAYSTISQLGFMVASVGLGGLTAGMFHMVTHAFFKACLFLSAGSVIHGCHHTQDMRLMGGIRKYMPITFICTLVCTLAIAGVPFFSGFYSKDMIILAGWAGVLDPAHGGWIPTFALVSLALAAMMTAFYMFRLIFMTFYGEYRGDQKEHMYSEQIALEGLEGPPLHGHDDDHGHDDHGHDDHHAADDHGHDDHSGKPHESPFPMVVALVILAFLGMFGGHFWLTDPGHLMHPTHSEPWFTKLASPQSMYGHDVGVWAEEKISVGITDHVSELGVASHNKAVALSLTVASLGIFLAWFLYVKRRDLPKVIAGKFGMLYTLVRRRYFIDEIADACFIKPTMQLCALFKGIDEKIIDGFVLLNGAIHKKLADFWTWVDANIIDGLVNFVGLLTQAFGAASRLLQTGRIQQYAAFAVGGGLLVIAWLLLS
ncbi:MAG: NADH-quinone oxidoreductase subunit L [Planctomycetota bacterium]|jgi:NADH-quinone oxidoreductase subunit L